MAMYPSIKFSKDSTSKTKKEAIRSDSEASYIMSRPRYTREKKSFELVYSNILISDFLILETFFTTYQGQNFTFNDVFSNMEYEVIFNMDDISFKPIGAGRCSTTVSLIEV